MNEKQARRLRQLAREMHWREPSKIRFAVKKLKAAWKLTPAPKRHEMLSLASALHLTYKGT